MAAWGTQRPFRDILDTDSDVTAVMTPADLDAAFDLNRALGNVDRTLAALDDLR